MTFFESFKQFSNAWSVFKRDMFAVQDQIIIFVLGAVVMGCIISVPLFYHVGTLHKEHKTALGEVKVLQRFAEDVATKASAKLINQESLIEAQVWERVRMALINGEALKDFHSLCKEIRRFKK